MNELLRKLQSRAENTPQPTPSQISSCLNNEMFVRGSSRKVKLPVDEEKLSLLVEDFCDRYPDISPGECLGFINAKHIKDNKISGKLAQKIRNQKNG